MSLNRAGMQFSEQLIPLGNGVNDCVPLEVLFGEMEMLQSQIGTHETIL